jgi:hypothetical protein
MEWINGRPNTPGFYWVALDADGKKETQMIMMISGFGKVLHYRILFPLEYSRRTEFRHISELNNCMAYIELTEPEWDYETIKRG